MTSNGVETRIGPYKILRKIGVGGMGAVFEAVHEAIERRVAIKVLLPQSAQSPEIATRFLNEARAVNRVGHPGMVQVSDLGQLPDGTAYLVMELLVGETLGARLQRLGGRLPLPQALDLGSQIADALAAAHAKGIVHRDLKPENLMVVADPVAPRGERIKVLDFGIAKLTEAPGFVPGDATRSNLLMGTPRYMSPEQCRGAGKTDAKADVYSLGVMLFQFLAGRLPFVSGAPGELIVMHMTEPPPPLLSLAPEAPEVVATLIEQMLAKAAASRPAMGEVAQQLQALLRSLEGRPSSSLEVAALAPAQPTARSPADKREVSSSTTPLSVTSFEVEASSARSGLGQPAAASTLGHSLGQSLGPLRISGAGKRRYLLMAPVLALLLVVAVGVRHRLAPAVPAASVGRMQLAGTPDPAARSTTGNNVRDGGASAPPVLTAVPAGSEVARLGSQPPPKPPAVLPPRAPPRGPAAKKPERKLKGGKSLFDSID